MFGKSKDAGKSGGADGGTADLGNDQGRRDAVRPTVGRGALPGETERGEAVVALGGSKQGDIGKVTHTVLGDADLPGRLGVAALADVANGVGGVDTAAFPAASGAKILVRGDLVEGFVAVVPGLLRNVAFCGAPVRIVGREGGGGCVPVGSEGIQRGARGVQEVCTANSDIVGGRGEATYSETTDGVCSAEGAGRGIAGSGATVTGGSNHSDALRGSLLVEVVEEGVVGIAEVGFAAAVADGKDRSLIVVDGADEAEGQAVCHITGCAVIEVDGGIGGDAAGLFDVELGFHDVAAAVKRRWWAFQHGNGQVAGAVGGKKILPVGRGTGEIYRCNADDADGDPGAVDAAGEQRGGVVDLGEITGGDSEAIARKAVILL